MAAQSGEIHPRWLRPEEFIKQHDRHGTESAWVWSEPGSRVSMWDDLDLYPTSLGPICSQNRGQQPQVCV